jgi:thymidylate synthase
MSEGFPLLTTKKMPFKTVTTELLWFLQGNTNIKYLVDNGCNIWTGDAYKNYINNPAYKAESVADLMSSQAGQLVKCSTQEEFINEIKTDDEFAKHWGELGPIYGKQWRSWGGYFSKGHAKKDGTLGVEFPGIDQIANLINGLKTTPDSRRLMVNAWNVGQLDEMVLPPCHYGFQVYTRELSLKERLDLFDEFFDVTHNSENMTESEIHEALSQSNIPTRAISLMWNQRSVDAFLGLPFNIASYGLLLEIIAKAVNMVPAELIGNLGDTHLYSNHVEQAKEQIGRELSLEERHQLALPIWKEKYGPLADMMVMTNVDNTPYKIPKRTREPYSLPTLKHMKTEAFYKSLSEDVSLVTHLDNTDFEMVNYQSHPSIKAPLSN